MQWSRRSTRSEFQSKGVLFAAFVALAFGVEILPAAAQAPGVAPSSVPAEPIVTPGARKRPLVAGPSAAEGEAKPPKKAAAKRPSARAASTDSTAEPAAAAPKPRPAAKPRVAAAAPAKGKAKKRRRGRQPTPAYQKLRDSWIAPVETPLTAALPVTGRAPLVLSQVNGGEVVTLVPQRDDGGFSDEDLQRAARAFAPKELGELHPIAPRLLDLVYRAMRHFNAPMVHVVSGYRKDRPGSRHTQGRAVDMALPGVSNEDLAAYVRTFGFCGVGIYPKSGFVHLDVRDKSYFWLDNSLPGERSRTTPMLAPEAIAADRAAAARGEAPDFFVPDNEDEDRAASKAYARRAKLRRARAARKLAREAQARNEAPKAAAGKAKPKAAASGGGFQSASVFGGLPP